MGLGSSEQSLDVVRLDSKGSIAGRNGFGVMFLTALRLGEQKMVRRNIHNRTSFRWQAAMFLWVVMASVDFSPNMSTARR